MGEVARPEGPTDNPTGLEVFDPREDDDDNDWWGALSGAVVAFGLGMALLLRWDSMVDGYYSRKTGGFERLLERIGQGPAVAVFFAAAVIFLALAVRDYRREVALDAETDVRYDMKETP